MKTLFQEYVAALRSILGKMGPYVLIELVLPGGTLIALLVFLYRRKRDAAGGAPFALIDVGLFVRVGDEMGRLSQAYGLTVKRSARDRHGLEALAAVPAG